MLHAYNIVKSKHRARTSKVLAYNTAGIIQIMYILTSTEAANIDATRSIFTWRNGNITCERAVALRCIVEAELSSVVSSLVSKFKT